jgi:hypothetical protein
VLRRLGIKYMPKLARISNPCSRPAEVEKFAARHCEGYFMGHDPEKVQLYLWFEITRPDPRDVHPCGWLSTLRLRMA